MMNRNMSQMLSGAMQQGMRQQAPMNRGSGQRQMQQQGPMSGNGPNFQAMRPGGFGMPQMGFGGMDPMQQRKQNNPQQAVQGFNNAHQQYMQNNQGGMFQHAFGMGGGPQTYGLNPQQQQQMNADRARYGMSQAQHMPQGFQGPMGQMFNMMNNFRGQY